MTVYFTKKGHLSSKYFFGYDFSVIHYASQELDVFPCECGGQCYMGGTAEKTAGFSFVISFTIYEG